MKTLKEFCAALFDKELMPTALQVSVVVGSLHLSSITAQRCYKAR